MIFIEKLRSETKSIHQALEKVLIPGIKQANSPEAYAGILKTFYGYFKGMEPILDAQLSDKLVPAYSKRRKSNVILEDLKSMNMSGELAVANDLPEISTVPQALGALYVLEGSTLGGRVITKMLMQNLNLTDTKHLQFFSGYGDQTEMMWGSFLETLNNASNDQTEDEIIQAAAETFSKFKTWIERSQ